MQTPSSNTWEVVQFPSACQEDDPSQHHNGLLNVFAELFHVRPGIIICHTKSTSHLISHPTDRLWRIHPEQSPYGTLHKQSQGRKAKARAAPKRRPLCLHASAGLLTEAHSLENSPITAA
ncbi:hypothetical protein VTL71DRAFT_6968 [Oculimacula yallundae]|uniref:Uncharacterized protein n=1 Tax=Oculimacula yallundae TaxID=86028 RepID=A0ABR4BWT9_9HELO